MLEGEDFETRAWYDQGMQYTDNMDTNLNSSILLYNDFPVSNTIIESEQRTADRLVDRDSIASS